MFKRHSRTWCFCPAFLSLTCLLFSDPSDVSSVCLASKLLHTYCTFVIPVEVSFQKRLDFLLTPSGCFSVSPQYNCFFQITCSFSDKINPLTVTAVLFHVNSSQKWLCAYSSLLQCLITFFLWNITLSLNTKCPSRTRRAFISYLHILL